MKKTFTFTHGTEKRTVELEEGLLGVPLISPRPSAAAAVSAKDLLRKALGEPVGRPRLRDMAKGLAVAITVSDEFRAGQHANIIDVLLEELVPAKPASVTVLCCTGTHDPKIYTPKVRAWTEEASARHGLPVVFVAHQCDDPALVDVGTTSRGTELALEPAWLRADVRVSGHEAKHHYMAGYSSILKHIVPGIAARKTVENNHKLALDDDSCAGQHPMHADPARRRNPFSEDALEAMRMAEKVTLGPDGVLVDRPAHTFLLDMISDAQEVFWAKAGDPEEVTRGVLAAADEQAEFTVPKARYVVLSPGGPPASTALYGVQNSFDLALLGAIQQGGEALVFGPCNGRPGMDPDVKGLAPDRQSKELFWDHLVRLKDAPLEQCYQEISDGFQLYLWKTWRVLRLFKRDRVRIWIHGELPAGLLAEGGFEHAPDPQAWVDEREARGDGRFLAIDGGNKLLVRPA
ncbi:MAG: lactate racemase domain-containing protein [Polyangia bacterium]|jgi:nickel-dependent lactate racemase|nr:lactate racemase domain-containing protein [Polyangia bacterium]